MIKNVFLFFFTIFLYGNEKLIVGESLSFNASFGGISAAKAKLEVLGKTKINDIKTYHVRFTANSIGLTNFIFPINDKIDIWLSEDSLKTIKLKSSIKEGSFKKTNELIIDHHKKYAISNNDTIPFKQNIHSPYSLFYFFRFKNLKNMENKMINTIQGTKKTRLNIIVEDSVKTRVASGDFLCTKVTPVKTDQRSFKNKSTMSILFSNGPNRYPVKIWLNLKYGALILELESITN